MIGVYSVNAQNMYWVFFTDKANTQFDPYCYFDSKAIERRLQHHIPLYDSTDFPLNSDYVQSIEKLSDEIIGKTRWLNAIAVVASNENIEKIKDYPFVKQILPIHSNMQLTSYDEDSLAIDEYLTSLTNNTYSLNKQLLRMEGNLFAEKGMDGQGIRIAVFDGGFPKVNTHPAFQHLRVNSLIIKTWNFPLKKENVYGWHPHGTMTLSCITGMLGNEKLGLATGAEFLLARTEVATEPAREEVWWMQAMEWADKNGANIISSSLGYNDMRYNTKDMDGQTSLVARAANLAAAKGILVCNSMGNEGVKNSWKIVITPADADSVLSVGGIDHNDYHTNFSSYGPTADGRLKPNVCAYATNCLVASPKKSNKFGYEYTQGTSFSCPLVAGFAACAWQAHPELKAMELKRDIERSADMYPYFDYAYGYGVPQASYFLYPKIAVIIPTFNIIDTQEYIIIQPITFDCDNHLFYHIQNENGTLDRYVQLQIKNDNEIKADKNASLDISTYQKEVKIAKRELYKNKTLRIFYKGYTYKYTLSPEDIAYFNKNPFGAANNNYHTTNYIQTIFNKTPNNMKPSAFGVNAKYNIQPYFAWGFILPVSDNKNTLYGSSQSFTYGLQFKGNIAKWYNLGFNLAYNNSNYSIRQNVLSGDTLTSNVKIKEKIRLNTLDVELYQRFRFVAAGQLGIGCFLDVGVYGAWNFSNFYITKKNVNQLEYKKTTVKTKSQLNTAHLTPLYWGVRARLGYGIIAVYAQYRLSPIRVKHLFNLPVMETGLVLNIPTSL